LNHAMWEDEADWFERAFGCAKFPECGRLVSPPGALPDASTLAYSRSSHSPLPRVLSASAAVATSPTIGFSTALVPSPVVISSPLAISPSVANSPAQRQFQAQEPCSDSYRGLGYCTYDFQNCSTN